MDVFHIYKNFLDFLRIKKLDNKQTGKEKSKQLNKKKFDSSATSKKLPKKSRKSLELESKYCTYVQ